MALVVKLLFALPTQGAINEGVSVRKIESKSGLGLKGATFQAYIKVGVEEQPCIFAFLCLCNYIGNVLKTSTNLHVCI